MSSSVAKKNNPQLNSNPVLLRMVAAPWGDTSQPVWEWGFWLPRDSGKAIHRLLITVASTDC